MNIQLVDKTLSSVLSTVGRLKKDFCLLCEILKLFQVVIGLQIGL